MMALEAIFIVLCKYLAKREKTNHYRTSMFNAKTQNDLEQNLQANREMQYKEVQYVKVKVLENSSATK